MARAAGGQFFLRMDDIDQSRARAHWAAQIEEDLQWLGLTWDGEVWSQHARRARYDWALQQLWDLGVLYPCQCSRADIKAAANAPQEGAPLHGPDGLIYPGTCRCSPDGDMPRNAVLRLNMRKALQHVEIQSINFTNNDVECIKSKQDMQREIGDIVLARKEMGASYHLSIVLDDADQCITHIIRGEDLFEASFIHVLLQRLLGFATPHYHHHPLIRDENGKRLAKRDDARAIAKYREDGLSPSDVRALIGVQLPIQDRLR